MRSITVMSVVLLAMAMVPLSTARPTVEDKVSKAYPEIKPLPINSLPADSSYSSTPPPTSTLPIDVPAGQPQIPHKLNLVDLTAQIQLDLSVLGLVNVDLAACTVVGVGVNNQLLFTHIISKLGISLGTTLDLNVDLKAAVGVDLAVLDQLVTLAVYVQIGLETYVVKVPCLV
ncbi:hypothetical protein IWQ61_006180 [Dispira simplex]|nr:hypothetical protein IWQ61_006180 [Dispira simplex]